MKDNAIAESKYLLRAAAILNPDKKIEEPVSEKDYLLFICHKMSRYLETELVYPEYIEGQSRETFLTNMAQMSNVRIRKVRLHKAWHTSDKGTLLAFSNGKPCILRPMTTEGYQIIKPFSKPRKVNITTDHIDEFAYSFTKPLPEKIKHFYQIGQFVYQSISSNLRLAVLFQIIISIIILSIPVLLGYFIDHISYLQQSNFITQLGMTLLVNAIILTLVYINQAFMLINIKFKIQSSLLPALWDKILKLPLGFFQRYHSGTLAFRFGEFAHLQEVMSQSAIVSCLGLVVMLLSFAVLVFYNVYLAIYASVCTALLSVIYFYLYRSLLHYSKDSYRLMTHQSGLLFQLVSNIIKVKVSASEKKAFDLLSEVFHKLLKVKYRQSVMKSAIQVMENTVIMLLVTGLFALYYFKFDHLSAGDFIAFNAIFILLYTNFLSFVKFLVNFIEILPSIKKSKVFFMEANSKEYQASTFVPLTGDISFKHVSFHYPNDKFIILRDFNLTIKPGEILGITGPSGCGKSTLFRIMLGFEKPVEGRVYFDNLNIDILNLRSLRSQVGMVSQRSKLLPGTIYENISSNDPDISRKEVWEIIENLGLSEMINCFPMKLDTYIHEGIQTLSGGEMQRIFLARALVKKPKILLLDEATSALDNKAQQIIHEYISQLDITQIIIAHRISTLKHSNRIIVIENGRISQAGSFEKLKQEQGFFADLAATQLHEM